MTTLSIELPTEVVEKVRGRLGNGRFESESQVVCEALKQMDDREYEAKLQTLREALAEGVRQVHEGECVDYSMQEIINELDAER